MGRLMCKDVGPPQVCVAQPRYDGDGEIFEYRGHRKKQRKSKNLLKQIGNVTNALELD